VRAKEPFMLQEKGWGAFDLRIIFHFIDNMVAPQLVWFDLNFAQESYFKVETLVSTLRHGISSPLGSKATSPPQLYG
jgi:transcription initiation factor IIF auxiliary subunit